MIKYIALLRGINVGGKNIISMTELKNLFIESGFEEVSSYINSGNIIFSSKETSEKILKKRIEELIENKFRLSIPTLIMKAEDLLTYFKMVPEWWGNGTALKHNAVFIMPPITAREALEKIGISEYEKVRYSGQLIFWSAKLKDFPKTRLTRIKGTEIANSITIRNSNTTKKIIEMIKEV